MDKFRTPRNLLDDENTIPVKLHPIFRDRTDLSGGGVLTELVYDALAESDTLIVLCSPAAVASKWVDKEVQEFLNSGRQNKIFPVISPDAPLSADVETELYPLSLRGYGILAADLREGSFEGRVVGDGGKLGRLKLIAGIIGVPLDSLIHRERQRQRFFVGLMGVVTCIFGIVAAVAVYASIQSEKNRKRAEKSLLKTSILYSEKLMQDSDVILAWEIFDEAKELGLKSNLFFDEIGMLSWSLDQQSSRPELMRTLPTQGYISLDEGTEGWIGFVSSYNKGAAGVINYLEGSSKIKAFELNGVIPSTISHTPNGWLLASSEEEKVWHVDDREGGSALQVSLPENFRPESVGPRLSNGTALIGARELGFSLNVTDESNLKGAVAIVMQDDGVSSNVIAQELAVVTSRFRIMPDSAWSFGPNELAGNFKSWEILRRDSVEAIRRGHFSASPDGKYAKIELGKEHVVTIFNPNMDKEKILSGFKTSVTVVAFSNDGKLIATGSEGGIVKVWETESSKLLWQGQFGISMLTDLVFVGNDTKLAAVNYDGLLAIYSSEKTAQPHKLPAPLSRAQRLFASKMGDTLAITRNGSGPISFWNVDRELEVKSVGESIISRPLTDISPSGSYLAYGDANSGYKVASTINGEEVISVDPNTQIQALSLGNKALYHTTSNGELYSIDLTSGETLMVSKSGDVIEYVSYEQGTLIWLTENILHLCSSNISCDEPRMIPFETSLLSVKVRGKDTLVITENRELGIIADDGLLELLPTSGAKIVAANWFGLHSLLAVTDQGDVLVFDCLSRTMYRRIISSHPVIDAVVTDVGIIHLIGEGGNIWSYDLNTGLTSTQLSTAGVSQ